MKCDRYIRSAWQMILDYQINTVPSEPVQIPQTGSVSLESQLAVGRSIALQVCSSSFSNRSHNKTKAQQIWKTKSKYAN